MEKFSPEEFLKLLQDIINEQEDDDTYRRDEVITNDYLNQYEPPSKKFQVNDAGILDLTKCKRENIEEELFKCTNIKVGNFTFKIKKYSMTTDPLTMDIRIFEDKTRTPSGNPCKMTYPVNIKTDTRFKESYWSPLFTAQNSAFNVPVETAIDIIKWLQAASKFVAFF